MKTQTQAKLSYLPLVVMGLMLCVTLGVAGGVTKNVQARSAELLQTTGSKPIIVLNPGHGMVIGRTGDGWGFARPVFKLDKSGNWLPSGQQDLSTSCYSDMFKPGGEYEDGLREDCLNNKLVDTLWGLIPTDRFTVLSTRARYSVPSGTFSTSYPAIQSVDYRDMDAHEFLRSIKAPGYDIYNTYPEKNASCHCDTNFLKNPPDHAGLVTCLIGRIF